MTYSPSTFSVARILVFVFLVWFFFKEKLENEYIKTKGMNRKHTESIQRLQKNQTKRKGKGKTIPAPVQKPKNPKNQLHPEPEHSGQFLPKTKEQTQRNFSSLWLRAPHPKDNPVPLPPNCPKNAYRSCHPDLLQNFPSKGTFPPYQSLPNRTRENPIEKK